MVLAEQGGASEQRQVPGDLVGSALAAIATSLRVLSPPKATDDTSLPQAKWVWTSEQFRNAIFGTG
ncbi:MAG TPA: hypothetical protein VMA72_28970 [Streptosporangiaceae bacterium]|nr:hypothetical protein [Streptosporangiaceae bacterium]